jgi:hypothetical protein
MLVIRVQSFDARFIPKCGLAQVEFKKLSEECMENNQALSTLILDGNPVGEDVGSLCKGLVKNSTLKVLSMLSCRIWDEEFTSIVKSPKINLNRSVEVVKVSSNRISRDSVIIALSEYIALADCRLRHLGIQVMLNLPSFSIQNTSIKRFDSRAEHFMFQLIL